MKAHTPKRRHPIAPVVIALATTLAAGMARADDGSSDDGEWSSGYSLGVAMTIGGGMYFIDGNVFRSPMTLEVVPSLGWTWFKFDFGLITRLESVEIQTTNIGYWHFSLRPGGRLTPPMIPLYLRVALPLEFQEHAFDWGLMLGLGLDVHVGWIFGLVLELDTSLTDRLKWGSTGLPMELRAGMSLHF